MGQLSTYISSTMPRKAAEFWWNFPIKGVERDKFICPPEVSYYIKYGGCNKWEPVTWKEVYLKRKEQNLRNINRELISYNERIVPCYIWVFHNDWDFPFGGWHIYVQTLKKDYALNFRTSRKGQHTELIEKIKDMYPVGVLTFDFEDWAKEFAKKYPKKSKKRKEEGAVLCWCKINERGDVVDIMKKRGQ